MITFSLYLLLSDLAFTFMLYLLLSGHRLVTVSVCCTWPLQREGTRPPPHQPAKVRGTTEGAFSPGRLDQSWIAVLVLDSCLDHLHTDWTPAWTDVPVQRRSTPALAEEYLV